MRHLFFAAVLSLTTAVASIADRPVATRMRHVILHVGTGVDLDIEDLSGHLVPTGAGPPVFDDVRSYVVAIKAARVTMTAESLTNLMNNHVFAASNAPIKDVKIAIDGQELTQSGTLKKGIPVPFTIRATVAATPDGRIRLHPTSIKAAGFLSKRVLDFFGLDLDNLVKMKDTSGVAVDGDDLLLDPQHLLPPPRIRGRVTRAQIDNGRLVQEFGGGAPRSAIAPPGHASNYMYYRGGTLRFGKLTMRDADLLLVDADPKDPFSFSPERYNAQLVAGYSKTTAARGLIVYMPDLADLPPSRSTRARAVETPDASRRRP